MVTGEIIKNTLVFTSGVVTTVLAATAARQFASLSNKTSGEPTPKPKAKA